MQSSSEHSFEPIGQRENRAGVDPNRPLTGERVRNDFPGDMFLRLSLPL